MISKLRKLALGLLLSAAVLPAVAQTKIGSNPAVLNPSAVLELESTNMGFLPPRVMQAQLSGILSPATGLMVYCLNCTPSGLYVYNGTNWVSVGSNNTPNATFANGTLACTGTPSGTYQMGRATDSSNTKQVTITSVSGGNYTATTGSAVNGVTFLRSGTLLSVGSGTVIELTASGVPQSAGTFTYNVGLGGQNCSFSVTYGGPATFACNSATSTQSPVGPLVNGTSYSGTYTLPYTGGNGQAYDTTSVTINGLKLTRTAGTYALSGSGNVVYTLSGTYTSTLNSQVTFTLPEGCSTIYGFDGIRRALATAGCASCGTYDTAAVNSWVLVSAAEYAALANASSVSGVSKVGMSDSGMAIYGTNGFSSSSSTIANTPGTSDSSEVTTIPASSYIIGFTMRYSANVAGGQQPLNISGQKVKWSTSLDSGFVQYGSAFPSAGISSVNTQLYLVNKRPNTATSAATTYLGTYSPADPSTFFANGINVKYKAGDVSNLGVSTVGTIVTQHSTQYQGLATSSKSW